MTCIPQLMLLIFSEIGFMVLILGLWRLLGWERLLLYDRYGCIEMTKFLIIKIILSCRLSTDVPVLSIYGHFFRGWRIATYLRRSVHSWRLRRGILFRYMSGRIVYGLVHHLHHRRSTIAHEVMIDMYFTFIIYCYLRLLDDCVHLSYAEVECNCLTIE
jgi:hypothetical protein